MTEPPDVSPLTLNRLSIYLRCLRLLQDEGQANVSSQELADRFHLSSPQIRKDLAHFGEFGVRGVGYDVATLAERIRRLLKLDIRHALVIVGMGNLGSALARYFGFNDDSFQVVAGVDKDPQRLGRKLGHLTVEPVSKLAAVVKRSGAEIGVIAVPGPEAQQAYDHLVSAGIRSVLNFAPAVLDEHPGVRLKNVDMRIYLEEMTFFLGENGGQGSM